MDLDLPEAPESTGIFRTYYGSTDDDPEFMKQDTGSLSLFALPENTLLFFVNTTKNQHVTTATPVADLGTASSDGKRSPFFTTCQQALLHYKTNLKDRFLCVLRTKRSFSMEMLRTSANKVMAPKNDDFKTKVSAKALYLGSVVNAVTTDDMEIVYVIPLPTDRYNESLFLPPGVYHGEDQTMFREKADFFSFDTQSADENYGSTPKAYAKLFHNVDGKSEQAKLFYDSTIYWRDYDAVLTDMISVWANYSPDRSEEMPVLLMEQQGNFLASGNALVLSLATSGYDESAGVLAWLSAAGMHPSRRTILGLAYGEPTGMSGLRKRTSQPVEYVDESIQGFLLSVDMDYHDGDYTHGLLTVVAAVAWGVTEERAKDAAYNMHYFLQNIIEYFGVAGDFVVMQTSRCFTQVSTRRPTPIITTHIGGAAVDNTWAKTELPLEFTPSAKPICVPDILKAGLDVDWSKPIPFRSKDSSMAMDRVFKITYPHGRTAPSVNMGPGRVRKEPPAIPVVDTAPKKKQKTAPDALRSVVDLVSEEEENDDLAMMDEDHLVDSEDESESDADSQFMEDLEKEYEQLKKSSGLF